MTSTDRSSLGSVEGAVCGRRLSRRELNRATLARQLLLERANLPVLQAIEQLAGLNAQHSRSPYLSLWSRLVGFGREELTRSLAQRHVARATLMRSTLHLATAGDYLLWRPALQATLLRAFRGYFKQEAARIDLERLCSAASSYMAEEARSFPELQTYLSGLEPGEDPASLSFAVRAYLPLVQVPPAGTWRFSGSPRYILAHSWFNRPLASPQEGRRQLILRYLAAFGPATRADLEAWSGLTGLRSVIQEMAPQLRTFSDEQGRVLLDVPEAPLPDPDVPVPPCFLPDWDNLLLAHADRSRVLPEAYRKAVIQTGGHVLPTFLVDGCVAGLWRIERAADRAVLTLCPFQPFAAATADALVAEGERLVRFVEDDAAAFAVQFAR